MSQISKQHSSGYCRSRGRLQHPFLRLGNAFQSFPICRPGFSRLHWDRFAFLPGDFKDHNIPALDAKTTDPNYKKFKEKYGTDAAELDALPPDELRSRMEGLILKHIDVGQWHQLQRIEKLENESWKSVMDKFSQQFPTPG